VGAALVIARVGRRRRTGLGAVLWLLTMALLVPVLAIAADDGRVTVRRDQLTSAVNGADGVLELRLDRRLTGDVAGRMWGHGPWDAVLPETSRAARSFARRPPVRAELRCTSVDGRLLWRRPLRQVLARLEPWDSTGSANRRFVVTEDFSWVAGIHNGPVTRFAHVSAGVLHWEPVRARGARAAETLELLRAGSADWRIVSRDPDVVLAVSWHADLKGPGNPVTDYDRYMFANGTWRLSRREVDGYWERSSEPGGDFPPASAFPP